MARDDVPEGMARIQAIREPCVWACVDGKQARPLTLDEVVLVPRNAELEKMKRNRHVVEIG